jgi:hypothetical protein
MARKQTSKKMDDLDLGFEISSIKKSSNVFKAGDYRFNVESIKLEWNKQEDIKTANIRLAFVGGEYDGKKLFARHPIASTRGDTAEQKEKQAQMVGMGLDRIKELGAACGVSGSNVGPCIGQEVIARIVVSPAKGNFDESNDVKKYLPAPKQAGAIVKPAAVAGAGSFLAKKKAAEAAQKAAEAALAAEGNTSDEDQNPAEAEPDSDLPF